MADVDDVGTTVAIRVRQFDPPLLKQCVIVKPRDIIHDDFGAENSIAVVMPDTYFVLSNAHKIGQAVARHVGEINRLHSIGEDDVRSAVFVGGDGNADRGAEAFVQK